MSQLAIKNELSCKIPNKSKVMTETKDKLE